MSEIKGCPFCLSTNIEIQEGKSIYTDCIDFYYVKCKTCKQSSYIEGPFVEDNENKIGE
jgi:hypothetical protein